MDQLNDDAWIAGREEAIERMWLEPITDVSQSDEIHEYEVPY